MNRLEQHNRVMQTVNHWKHIADYIQVSHTEEEYEKQMEMFNTLMTVSRKKQSRGITSLLDLIASNIEHYETEVYPPEGASGIEVLKYLMNEHNLTQSDLPEIGSQSLVSKVLTGKRQLTTDHIYRLSKRFGVSPAVFI